MKALDDGVNKRILQLMKALHYSRKDLAKCLGYKSSQSFSRLFRPSDPVLPSFTLIEKLCMFTSVNPEWLILGRGPMLRPSGEESENAGQTEPAISPAQPSRRYEFDQDILQSSILEGDYDYELGNGHQIVDVLCHHAQQIGALKSRLDYLQQAFDQLKQSTK